MKYEEAVSLQHFDSEIEPIIISSSKSRWRQTKNTISYLFNGSFVDNVEVRHDEHSHKGISLDALSKLNTIFKEGRFSFVTKSNRFLSISYLAGTVTKGNSSGWIHFLLTGFERRHVIWFVQ